VELAKNNLVVNDIETVTVIESKGFENSQVTIFGPYDLIMANIHSNILCQLSGQIHDVLKPEGICLLSGLLIDQEEEVLAAYKKLGFSLIKSIHENNWSTLLLSLGDQHDTV